MSEATVRERLTTMIGAGDDERIVTDSGIVNLFRILSNFLQCAGATRLRLAEGRLVTNRRDRRAEMAGVMAVSDLEQIRALAHPLRQRILAALAAAARTTKQVAAALGERHTKLYHHVELLEEVGLIRLTETRPNRGTTEKYYRAVAGLFHVTSGALSPAVKGNATLTEIESLVGTV